MVFKSSLQQRGDNNVTSVTASTPLASSGGVTPNISLTGIVAIANGGTAGATAAAAQVNLISPLATSSPSSLDNAYFPYWDSGDATAYDVTWQTIINSVPVSSPGGSSGQLQYNNSSSFGGTAAGIYATSGNLFTFTSQAATDIPLALKAHASQSGNIFEVKNNAGTAVNYIDNQFRLVVGQATNQVGFGNFGSGVTELNSFNNAEFQFRGMNPGVIGNGQLQFRDNNDGLPYLSLTSRQNSTNNSYLGLITTRYTPWASTGNDRHIVCVSNASQVNGLIECWNSSFRRLFTLNNIGNPEFWGDSSTNTERQIGSIVQSWATSTDASRKGRVVVNVYDTAIREALRMEADGSRAWAGVPAGNSTAYGKLGGTIFDHFADAGNVTTGETDLYSDTTPASTLATNGDKLEAEYGGVFVSSATATRQIKIYFAGTVIFDTGALTLSLSSAWTAFVSIIRVSSSVIRYMISFTTEGAALSAYTSVGELTGLTLSNTNILKITGQAAGVGAATNDIVAKMASVSWQPVA